MKKTFRLAAVLVTLAALVMASCQNAAGGSGGGGGGGVTPTPTPPEPEAKSVTGDAIQFVGTYKVNDYTNLVLKDDGTGSFSFGTSASVRSIALADVEFTWNLEDLTLEGMLADKGDNDSDTADVDIPYIDIKLPEGAKIEIDGGEVVYAAKGATAMKETTVKIPGLQVSLFGGDGGAVSSLGGAASPVDGAGLKLTDSSGDFDSDLAITSGRGFKAVFNVDGVMMPSDGQLPATATEPNAPKPTELAGRFELYSETADGTAATTEETTTWVKVVLKDAYDTINGYDFNEDDEEYGPAGTADAVNYVFLPTVIDVKADGGEADVVVMVFDGNEITADSTDFGDKAERTKLKLKFGSDTVTVTDMAKLEGDNNVGYAMGVIEGCKVEVVQGKITLAKLADNASALKYVELFSYDNTSGGDTDLTANVPFLSIDKEFKEATNALGKAAAVAEYQIFVQYKKAN